ncbi:hypothetical protein [Anabaenopsis arnoldii]|nr:hypothetical protein [Anabaenopsis arnoldii]MDH6091075.1 hypothetical protein [Anabaenopsis arnoldii]
MTINSLNYCRPSGGRSVQSYDQKDDLERYTPSQGGLLVKK